RRLVPVLGDRGPSPAPARGHVALEGVEVADAGRLGDRRQKRGLAQLERAPGALAAAAAQPLEHRARAKNLDAVALELADAGGARAVAKAHEPHGGSLARIPSPPCPAPSSSPRTARPDRRSRPREGAPL